MLDIIGARNNDFHVFRLRSKSIIYGSLFFAGLFFFELVFLNKAFNFSIPLKHIASGTYVRLTFVLLLSLVSLGLSWTFFTMALESAFFPRIIYFLIFTASTLVEFSNYRAFGSFSGYSQAEILFFAADLRFVHEAGAIYFSYLALCPVFTFGLLLIGTRRFQSNGLRALLGILLAFVVFFGLTGYFTRNTFTVDSLDSTVRTLVGFPVVWYIGTIEAPRRSATYGEVRKSVDYKSDAKPTNNIVFIVDESVRGDRLSLNGYAEATSAYLDLLSQNGFVKNWGIAASGATCSVASNNLLLTGLNELPDPALRVYSMPTIFQYGKAMNYHTYFFDGQVSRVWLGKPSDSAFVDEWFTGEVLLSKAGQPYDVDADIAATVRKIVGTSTGNFIWINKRGVHTPYTAAFPAEDASKKNTDTEFTYLSTDPRVLSDQYDKAIRYNLLSFFSNLVEESGPKAGNFYVYTSDHGQTLSENGARASHCTNHRSEAVVPLLMIARPETPSQIDLNFKATHSNIFATLLDLMNFPESERKYAYSVSLLKARASDSKPRFYFDVDLTGIYGGSAYPFD